MKNKLKNNIPFILMLIAIIFSNYCIERTQTTLLFIAFLICIGSYYFTCKGLVFNNYYKYWGWAIRFSIIFVFPGLSDDIYRFYWDGKLLTLGINPFQHLPSEISTLYPSDTILQNIYPKLNSPNYYSVYPAICQYVFWILVKIGDSIINFAILLKLVFFVAECITIEYIIKVLKKLDKPVYLANWYIFNPLIIFELVGNCHFETLMITFTILFIYYLFEDRLFLAALFFSLAFNVKLLPLIFIPLVLKKIGILRFIPFSITFAVTFILLNITLITPEIVFNIGKSLDLYFQKFEFNASFYYLLRHFGFKIYGYNTIHNLGPFLSICTIGSIIYAFFTFKYPFNNIDFLKKCFFILFCYLLFSTTVHPWYISFLVLLGTLISNPISIFWSCLVLFTYATYAYIPYSENIYIVIIEYCSLATLLFYQWKTKNYYNQLN
jgi:alpha-1,6-mannosyltransferase